MSKTTLKVDYVGHGDYRDIVLYDVERKAFTGISAIMRRLHKFRTGTVIDIVSASTPNIVFDANKTYYMIFDDVMNTVHIIYVNLAAHVVHIIAQTSTYNWDSLSKAFCDRLCSLVGTVHILHSNDRRAYTVAYVPDCRNETYTVDKAGAVKLNSSVVVMENSYRNVKGKVVTERYLDLASAVQNAIQRQKDTVNARYAVVAPKGAVVFFI